MANLRTAMDSGFWDLNIATPQSLLEGSARCVPGEPFPVDGARASRALRIQQLSLLGNGFPLGIIPSFSPTSPKELGSFSLQSLFLNQDFSNWYRFGLHQNGGNPRAVNSSHGDVPLALLPGFCAKAAFSYEKSKDLWRQRETKKDVIIETEEGRFWQPAYDIRLKEPHAAISGIIGGTCAAWIGGRERSAAVEMKEIGDSISMSAKKRSPFSADLFGSVCYTFQHGKFRKLFGDLSRVDARLDICSASALAQRVSKIFKGSSLSNAENPLSSPRLNLILQQQVAGPIVFRVDSKFLIDSSSGKQGMHMEDLIYCLSYSLRLLQSGKVVAWYSPKRKEAMIEMRLFEF